MEDQDRVRKLISRHRRVDGAVVLIAESLGRTERLLDREESLLIRELRNGYSDRTVVLGGKAYTLVDDELYIRDVVDLDAIEDLDVMPDVDVFRSHHSCNPDWNPGDLLADDWDSVVSDGEAS